MREAVIPTIREVQEAVAARWGVTVLDLVSQRRTQPAVRLRQIAMWLCRHTTLHGYPPIGRAFGDRDHTTVMHAIRRVDEMLERSPELALELAQLRYALNSGESVDSVEKRRAMMRLVA